MAFRSGIGVSLLVSTSGLGASAESGLADVSMAGSLRKGPAFWPNGRILPPVAGGFRVFSTALHLDDPSVASEDNVHSLRTMIPGDAAAVRVHAKGAGKGGGIDLARLAADQPLKPDSGAVDVMRSAGLQLSGFLDEFSACRGRPTGLVRILFVIVPC